MTLNIPAAIALSVLVASVAAAPAIAAKSRNYKVQTTTNVPYGDDPLQILDVCQPVGAPGNLPAFIVIHGGGWSGGDKSGYYTANLCNRLALQGYVAFNINYRLVQGQDDPSTVLPNANALDTFPTPFLDAQLAVRWVRSQVAYPIDPNSVCAVGFSAGAHLATFLGAVKTIYPGDVADQLPTYSPGVACVAGHSSPVDLTLAITGPPNSNDYWGEKALVNQPATTDYTADYEAASPLYQVSPSSAPMFLSNGTQDKMVFPEEAVSMQSALQASGVPVFYQSYNGGHVFFGLAQSAAWSIIDQGTSWALANRRWP